jgi:hypothetical protein
MLGDFAMNKHGDIRHHGYRTTRDEPQQFGSAMLSNSYTESIVETYCGHCRKWIETNGVLGPLRFMATHRDGECAK